MYFIARKTNIMTFWLNARIFSTHPYFLAINIGRRECILKLYFFLKVQNVQFKIRLRSALSSDGVCTSSVTMLFYVVQSTRYKCSYDRFTFTISDIDLLYQLKMALSHSVYPVLDSKYLGFHEAPENIRATTP